MAEITEFQRGIAYENGILRRVLDMRPGLMDAEKWVELALYMREERARNPPDPTPDVEDKLRAVLKHRGYRTDGDLAKLLDRVEHMARSDGDYQTMNETLHQRRDVEVTRLRAVLNDVLDWGSQRESLDEKLTEAVDEAMRNA